MVANYTHRPSNCLVSCLFQVSEAVESMICRHYDGGFLELWKLEESSVGIHLFYAFNEMALEMAMQVCRLASKAFSRDSYCRYSVLGIVKRRFKCSLLSDFADFSFHLSLSLIYLS
jgi:hypothetical protein